MGRSFTEYMRNREESTDARSMAIDNENDRYFQRVQDLKALEVRQSKWSVLAAIIIHGLWYFSGKYFVWYARCRNSVTEQWMDGFSGFSVYRCQPRAMTNERIRHFKQTAKCTTILSEKRRRQASPIAIVVVAVIGRCLPMPIWLNATATMHNKWMPNLCRTAATFANCYPHRDSDIDFIHMR